MKSSLFNPIDLIAFPLAIVVFYFVGRAIVSREDLGTRRYFFRAFWIRVFALLAFSLLMEFYFGGGDSYRYYISIQDMRSALEDGQISLWELLTSESAKGDHPLFGYFFIDGLGENHYYMESPSNFFVPKVGVLISYPFFNSYLAIGMCFSFLALLGSLSMYKVFYSRFPDIKHQIALACFFIPTVCFWSSGVLKDSLTFAATGFLLKGVHDIFFQRRNTLLATVLIVASVYLLYVVKPYILLAMAPALMLFVLTHISVGIRSLAVKRLVFFFMIGIGIAAGFLLYDNITSEGALQKFATGSILEQMDRQRSTYEIIKAGEKGGSSFSLGTDEPLLMFPLGIVASYFRPFPWEISSPIIVLNVIESLLCLFLVLYTFVRVGLGKTFNKIFSDPYTIFCFIFSILFGGAVGTSTGNFGALVRYKIPSMPLFVITFLITLHLASISLPRWLQKSKPIT